MPIPTDLRRKPTEIKAHVSAGTGLDIVWADGHASHYDFAYLREQCPCATCDDERRRKQELEGKGLAAPATLPLYKPRPGARSVKPVGHYALQVEFTDGHATGIYSYDYLRGICPCGECAAALRSGGV